MAYYILPKGFALRGWKGLPFALQYPNLRSVDFFDKEEYRVVYALDGRHDWLRGVEGAERGYACGETSTDYLGIDEEVRHFFQSGWYEKAVELRDKYRELCFPPVEEEQKQE